MREPEDTDDQTNAALQAALADPALATLHREGAPVLLFGDEPARVLYANAAARALFPGDETALGRRLLQGAEPGARRLYALSRSLLPGAAPRLERLRFFFGPVAETVTVLCQRVATPQGAVFVVAALGARSHMPAAPKPPAVAAVDSATPVEAPAPSPVAELNAQLAKAQAEAARPQRFIWRTDANNRLTDISESLALRIGGARENLIGRLLTDIAQAPDDSRPFAELIDLQATFDQAASLWTAPGGARTAEATIGAVVVRDAQQRFAGYRGFGVLSGVVRMHARPAAPTPAIETEPATKTHIPALSTPELATPELATPALAAPELAPKECDPPVAEDSATRAIALADDAKETPEDAMPDEISDDRAKARAENGALLDKVQNALNQIAAAQPVVKNPPANVVPLRPAPEPVNPAGWRGASLSAGERQAFHDIARALGADAPATLNPAPVSSTSHDATNAPETPPGEPRPAGPRDLIDLLARIKKDDGAAEAAQPAPVASEPPAEQPDAHARNCAGILERLPVGVLVSRDNVAVYANRTLLDLLDFDDLSAFRAAGELDAFFCGLGDGGTTQVRARDGELLPVDARVQTIAWDGAPATLTTLRRAREAQAPAPAVIAPPVEHQRDVEPRRDGYPQESARDADLLELRAMLDTATDGVARLDAHGVILSLNKSGEALIARSESEIIGHPVTELAAPESQNVLRDYIASLNSTGVAGLMNDGREVLIRAGQGAIPVFVTIGRLGGGETPKYCMVMRDLTAWKRAERELGEARKDAERASALKSDFLAKVSHEIRTPLNAILGFAEVMIDERFGALGNERYRDYMRDIHKSGEHVMSLVNDLLDLSKIEAGKMDMNFSSVDANSIVSECVSLMQPQANRERVVVRLSLAHKLPPIVADARSIKQIVLNLLSNAVKFNDIGGQVIVSTALTDAGGAVIRIKDTGLGMSEAELATALEPFRQVAPHRAAGGTGLGLPLTKALVEANRAAFIIKSQPGDGTLVEVLFPPTRVLAE